jgi:hypothetical protein
VLAVVLASKRTSIPIEPSPPPKKNSISRVFQEWNLGTSRGFSNQYRKNHEEEKLKKEEEARQLEAKRLRCEFIL